MFNFDQRETITDIIITPTIAQFDYKCFERMFAVEFDQLWDIEKHFFLDNLVKIISPTIAITTQQVDGVKPKVPKSLTLESNFESSLQRHAYKESTDSHNENPMTKLKSSHRNSVNIQEGVDKPSEHEINTLGSHENLNPDQQTYWRSNTNRKVRVINVTVESQEKYFKRLYLRDADGSHYMTPVTFAVMQSNPENQIGVKVYTYSTVSLRLRGIFLAVNQLFWKKAKTSNSSEHLSENTQLNEDPDSLEKYIIGLEKQQIIEMLDLETVDEFYQREMRLDKFKLASGHEIHFQSLDCFFDLSIKKHL